MSISPQTWEPSTTHWTVDAHRNSFSGGSPVNTIAVLEGEIIKVSVNASEIWNIGHPYGWSTADGLDRDLYATGTDASGAPEGTGIGTYFGKCALGAFAAPFGALVGKIGGGRLFFIGTHYQSTAHESGILRLYYWDSDCMGNQGSINVELTTTTGKTWFSDVGMTR